MICWSRSLIFFHAKVKIVAKLGAPHLLLLLLLLLLLMLLLRRLVLTLSLRLSIAAT
jgi:hypothetical protein